MPDFIRVAIEWSKVAASLRTAQPDASDPLRSAVLGLPRELAWCHLLAAAGRPDAAVASLRAFLRDAVATDPPAGAAGLLDRLRLAVSARYPAAVTRPAA